MTGQVAVAGRKVQAADPVSSGSAVAVTARQRAAWWTTPGQLKFALGLIWALALLCCVAVLVAVREHRRGMQTIGRDAAPSIIAAQSIKANLADMQSQSANQLLLKPSNNAEFVKLYDQRRKEATEGILAAAGNITYGDAERVPLRTLLNALGEYEAAVAQALVLHERKDSGFLQKQREADRLMQGTLLPAAAALDQANRAALDQGYTEQQRSSWLTLAGVLATGGMLLASLIAVQWFLTRRTRRLLNPGLLAATAVAAGFLVYTATALRAEVSALKVAKQDAFESIHVLWQARAVANEANGEESRWLLDRAQAESYEKAFFAKSARIVKLPPGVSPATLLAELEQGRVPTGFEGYLAIELRNITFAGERDAALEALKQYFRYFALDARIRQLENDGLHAEAVRFCLSYQPGDSNWASGQFDAALGRVIDINQKAFDEAVARGFQALAGFEATAPVTTLGIALLSLFGLRPRIAEYRFR